jgi:hypothetical protein
VGWGLKECLSQFAVTVFARLVVFFLFLGVVCGVKHVFHIRAAANVSEPANASVPNVSAIAFYG